MQHAYGWRSVPATSSTAGNSVSHRSNTPSSSFQVRPAITSFMGSAATNSWNNHMNRAGGQQQQQPMHVGSPARATDGPANGTHVGAHSGWMLADPAGWSGWASAGRVCSGFEENQVVSFSWAIPEANLLRDEVEKSPLPSEGGRSISAGAGKSEVWTTQPIFGDGKWKLELVRTSRPDEGIMGSSEKGKSQEDKEEEKATGGTTVLSVYLTSMVLDYSSPELEIPASIMIGIRPVHSPAKTARSGSWIWREFVHHVFRREHEYYECHQLPRLSDLLQDKDVQRQDAFTLTVQISTGPRGSASQDPGGRASGANEASPFAVQDKQLVHHSLINGLERLLDCKSTGDVVLIVRERGIVKTQAPSSTDGPKDAQDEVWTLPVGTPLYDWAVAEANGGSETQVVVRDRLLWAHASILGARSEFFHDMLQSHFAEGQEQNLSTGETHGDTMQLHGRRVKTLRIKDTDFTTIYWLLRYLYLEEVEFISSEEVRCAALDDEWMTLGEDRAEEGAQRAVWEWKPLRHFEAQDEEHQATSQQEFFHHTSAGSHHTRSLSRAGQTSTSQGTPATPQTPGAISPNRNRPVIPRELYGSYPRRPGSDWDSRTSRSYPQETTQSAGDAPLPPQSLLSDPHEHPCAKPPPASALALYRLAHRYHQQGLAHLSKVQLISSLTPQTAFPTLLATNLYEDLYEDVKAYVLDNWDSVSQTSEFERCCDEVSTGEVSLRERRESARKGESLTAANVTVGRGSWSCASSVYALAPQPSSSEVMWPCILNPVVVQEHPTLHPARTMPASPR